MRTAILGTALVALFLVSFPPLSLAADAKKTVLGRVERIALPKYGISFETRIDTGAHSCSLHVINQKITKVDDVDYIEFDTEDSEGKRYHIKTRVHRESLIRSTAGETTTRYVIREEVKLGKVTKEVNINLNDRTELKYNFLLGRNFLRGDFVVDVARSHLLGD